MKQSEMKENITNIIFDYSQEFNIAPQFIEKDYYVVKVLEKISEIDYPNVEIISFEDAIGSFKNIIDYIETHQKEAF